MTFTIFQNETTAILGKNGTGKTTLLKVLLGENLLRSGRVEFQGIPLSALPLSTLATKIAYLPQEQTYPSHLRLIHYLQLAYLGRMGFFRPLPENATEEIEAMAAQFHLTSLLTRKLGEMSTGERQKSFLARTLLQKTEVLILDEPTNHLDPSAINEFWTLLEQARSATPLSIVVSSHDLSFMKRLSHRIIAMGPGGLIASSDTESFFASGGITKVYGEIRAS